MKNSLSQAAILAITIAATPLMAGDFELGVVASHEQSPLAQFDDETEFAPIINYRGERFNLQYGTLSYTFYESDHSMVHLLAEGRSLGYKASDSKAFTGMKKREDGFDAGVRMATGGNWGVAQLQLLNDISDTHQGFEASLAYSYPTEQGRWIFEPAIGVKAQNKDLIDYYYGVRGTEVSSERQAYEGEAAINPYLEFAVGYKLDRKWDVITGMEYTVLDSAISDSPIVEEDYRLVAFAVVVHKF